MRTFFSAASPVAEAHYLLILADEHGVVVSGVDLHSADLLEAGNRAIVFKSEVVTASDHHATGHLDFVDGHRELNRNFLVCLDSQTVRIAEGEGIGVNDN